MPSGTTLAWLVAHLAQAESRWVEQRFAGVEPHRIELPADRTPTIAEARRGVPRGLAEGRRARRGVGARRPRARRDDTTPPVNLRWVLAHLLEETARHAGHADVLRELIDGETGR